MLPLIYAVKLTVADCIYTIYSHFHIYKGLTLFAISLHIHPVCAHIYNIHFDYFMYILPTNVH